MFVVFIGPPGAGKGTQAKLLAAFLRIPHLSTGEMLRQARAEGSHLGNQVHGILDSGQLVADSIMIDVVRERLARPDCAQGCLLDGYPRTANQAKALDGLLAARGAEVDIVLELAVGEDDLLNRLTSRGREDDRPDVIRERFRAYNDEIPALLEFYRKKGLLHTIDGLGSTDAVFHRIKQALPRQKK